MGKKPKPTVIKPEFGREFLRVLNCVVLNDRSAPANDEAKTAVVNFLKRKGHITNTSRAYKWFDGMIQGENKTLTVPVLRQILIEELGKPGLDNLATLKNLTDLGLPEYRQILNDEQFVTKAKSLIESGKLSTGPYVIGDHLIDDATIDRNHLMKQVIASLEKKPSIVVLLGPTGTGKSTILNQLVSQEVVKRSYYQIIVFDLEGKDKYEELITNLAYYLDVKPFKDNALVWETAILIKSKLQSVKTLVLLKNVRDYGVFRKVQNLVNNFSTIIASTDQETIAKLLDPTLGSTIEVSGFTPDEAERLYSLLSNRPPDVQIRYMLHTIGESYGYRPEVIRYAYLYGLTKGWAWEIEHYIQEAIKPEFVALNFSLMSEFNRALLRKLAESPYFRAYDPVSLAALWSLPDNEVKRENIEQIITDINQSLLAFTPLFSIDGKILWKFNRKVYDFINNQENFSPTNDKHTFFQTLAKCPENNKDYLCWKDSLTRGKLKLSLGRLPREKNSQSLLQRILSWLFNTSYSTELSIMEKYPGWVSTYDYRLACHLRDEDQRDLWLARIALIGAISIFGISFFLPSIDPNILNVDNFTMWISAIFRIIWPALILLLCLILIVVWGIRATKRIPLWTIVRTYYGYKRKPDSYE